LSVCAAGGLATFGDVVGDVSSESTMGRSRDCGVCFELASLVLAVVEMYLVRGFAFTAWWWMIDGDVERVDALGLPFKSESKSSDDDDEGDVAGSEGE